MQGGAALARIPGAPRGLAVDGDHIVLADTLVYGAEALRPGDEAVAEGVVVERVEQVVDGVVAGYALLVGQEAAQEIQVDLAPCPTGVAVFIQK